MRQELSDKYSNLCAALRREKKLAVAFSAGVDSTLLLKAAVNTLGNENVLAVTALSASFPEREADEADVFTRGIGVSRITVEVDQLSIPGFRENPANRCYLCKKVLFTQMMEAAREKGFTVMAEEKRRSGNSLQNWDCPPGTNLPLPAWPPDLFTGRPSQTRNSGEWNWEKGSCRTWDLSSSE